MAMEQQMVDIALEESRQLQEVIERHEDQAFKIRGWMYGILAVLAAAFFDKNAKLRGPEFLKGHEYLLVSGVVILMFLWNELMHRLVIRRAILRAADVQKILREGTVYDGPLLSDSLIKDLKFSETLKALLKEFLNGSVVVHFLAIVVVVVLIDASRPEHTVEVDSNKESTAASKSESAVNSCREVVLLTDCHQSCSQIPNSLFGCEKMR